MTIYVAMKRTPKSWTIPFQSQQGFFGSNFEPSTHSKWDMIFFGTGPVCKVPLRLTFFLEHHHRESEHEGRLHSRGVACPPTPSTCSCRVSRCPDPASYAKVFRYPPRPKPSPAHLPARPQVHRRIWAFCLRPFHALPHLVRRSRAPLMDPKFPWLIVRCCFAAKIPRLRWAEMGRAQPHS